MVTEKHQSKFHQITVSSLDRKKWFNPGTEKQCVVHLHRLHMWKRFWQSKYYVNKSQQSSYFNDFSSTFFCSISNWEMVELFALCSFGIFLNTCLWYDCITTWHSFRSWILKVLWKQCWQLEVCLKTDERYSLWILWMCWILPSLFSWFNKNGNLLQTT